MRRNPAEYVAMVRHEAIEEVEVSSGDCLGFAEHDVAFADCDFRKNFSGGRVRDREVGAGGPVLPAALGVDDMTREKSPLLPVGMRPGSAAGALFKGAVNVVAAWLQFSFGTPVPELSLTTE